MSRGIFLSMSLCGPYFICKWNLNKLLSKIDDTISLFFVTSGHKYAWKILICSSYNTKFFTEHIIQDKGCSRGVLHTQTSAHIAQITHLTIMHTLCGFVRLSRSSGLRHVWTYQHGSSVVFLYAPLCVLGDIDDINMEMNSAHMVLTVLCIAKKTILILLPTPLCPGHCLGWEGARTIHVKPVPYILHVHAHTHIHSLSHKLIIQLLYHPVVSDHPISTVMLYVLAVVVVALCGFFSLCLATCRCSWWFSTRFPHRGHRMFSVWFLQM